MKMSNDEPFGNYWDSVNEAAKIILFVLGICFIVILLVWQIFGYNSGTIKIAKIVAFVGAIVALLIRVFGPTHPFDRRKDKRKRKLR